MRVDLVAEEDGEEILSVGGRWDKRLKDYVADATTAKVFRLHAGQVEAARFFARWCESKVKNERLTMPILVGESRAEEQKQVWVIAHVGGRRGGKTDLSVKESIAFPVLYPSSKTWLVSENQPKTEELEEVIAGLLPRDWYTYLGAPWFRYTLINGSTIHLRSAHDPEALKRGRADFVFFNEAQNIPERAYIVCRAAIADRGGLIVLAANPPDKPVGQWVADLYDGAKARRRAVKLYELDPKRNPHVRAEALDDMKGEVSLRTYRQEVLGEFLGRTDVVFPEWSAQHNEQPVPELGDVTRDYLRRVLGGGERDFDAFVGADFQLMPHMAGAVGRFFAAPGCACGGPHPWYTDEVVIEDGDENDLADGIIALGLEPSRVAVIADASGEWQNAERTKGRASCDILRRRGFRVFLPDRDAKKNPLVIERVKAAAARICSADGARHVFSSPSNFYLNRALRLWDNKQGLPARRSQYAHLGDAFSYPLIRFYPRRAPRVGFEYHAIQRPTRDEDFRGF